MSTEAVGPVHRTAFSVNAATPTQVIAADPQGRSIRILGIALSNNHASTAVIVTVQDDDTVPNTLIGPLQLGVAGSVVLPESRSGWGEGAKGKAIDIVLDGTEIVGGAIIYQYVGSRGPAA
jgi:hypothetical protein